MPTVWAGRDEELADFANVVLPRRVQGVDERGRMILGEPGIGKSVLVNRVAEEAADAGHWVLPSVRFDGGSDPVRTALSIIVEAARQRGLVQDTGLLERIESVSLPVVGGGVDLRPKPGDEEPDVVLRRLLVEICRSAFQMRPRRLVLVRFDEVQHLRGTGLSRLLTILSDVLATDLERQDPAEPSTVRFCRWQST